MQKIGNGFWADFAKFHFDQALTNFGQSGPIRANSNQGFVDEVVGVPNVPYFEHTITNLTAELSNFYVLR